MLEVFQGRQNSLKFKEQLVDAGKPIKSPAYDGKGPFSKIDSFTKDIIRRAVFSFYA